jgi:hypothetical protein
MLMGFQAIAVVRVDMDTKVRAMHHSGGQVR